MRLFDVTRGEPALTVLMPLRNHHPELLRRALASLFAQTSPAWRLLVVVEAADVRRFAGLLAPELGDARVRLVANEGRKLAGAFNTGMRHATTDFVAILLADDLWSPDAVDVLARAIAGHPEVDFFHSARAIVDEHDRRISSVHQSRPSFTLDDFRWTSPVKHLLCWRRALALAIGGMDESLNSVGPDDYDFPWCMAERGATFHAIEECLYLYRDHREAFRLTTHLPLSVHRAELRKILRKHGVDPTTIRTRLTLSEQSYLRQCLYASPVDRLWKNLRGVDARSGWRETYR